MNRRTKIIVSVAGIFIVLLALLGITYAYFLTKINGNSNTKSISVTTANLELTYGDGNGAITANNIMPGTTITSKNFTVSNNNSTSADYVVTLENVINDFSRQQDIIYILTCTSTEGTCNGINNFEFPGTTDVATLVQNIIPGNATHTYNLTVKYNEADVNQSIDMGKELSAKVNIEANTIYREGTLANAIISNAKANKNGTSFRTTPLTTPINSFSSITEKNLNLAADDYGTSYYYRGNVTDNYLEFNNICWRIVRIEGDGSIKLTLAKEDKCSSITSADTYSALINRDNELEEPESVNYGLGVGYSANTYIADYEGGQLYDRLKNWYDTNLKSVENKLKNENWCLGSRILYDYNGEKANTDDLSKYINEYGDLNLLFADCSRISYDKKATYRCSADADIVMSYIGTLTADEVIFAGSTVSSSSNISYYLRANAQWYYWTLSLSEYSNYSGNIYENLYYVKDDGGISVDYLPFAVRPVITLKSGTLIDSGDGTQNNPYKIK